MDAFLAMTGRQLKESRWPLVISVAALFGLSWLVVFSAAWTEARIREATQEGLFLARFRMMRALGGSEMDFSSGAIEMTFWVHPMILLPVVIWAIARGSAAPAGEIEKGTLDLTLSRPVSRASYLASQVFVAVLGLFLLTAALIAGNLVGARFNQVEQPPLASQLAKPALNLAALGLAIYGYAVMLSAADSVRWRPNLIASVFTLASFIARVFSALPFMEGWRWKPWLERSSILTAYDPVDAVGRATHLAMHLGVLTGVGLAGILLAFLAFLWRDLPASS
jgi:beta-exotoxin I transport system permease protein